MNAPKLFPTSSPNSRSLIAALCMSAALACGFLSAAIADDLNEVPLNSDSITLNSQDARLVRTAMTPSKVEIHLPIAMTQMACTRTADVPHTGRNGAMCGYDRIVRRVCRPVPPVCHIDPRSHREICYPRGSNCYNEVISIPRTCTWVTRECIERGPVTANEPKKVLLKFKHMAPLAAGEVEIFDLHGAQKRLDGSEAVFSMSAVSTKKPVSIKDRDGLFTLFKDVIIIKGE